MTAPHLWEYHHPYFCEDGNRYANDHHERYDSWHQFALTTLWHSGDRDMNLLFRWDWFSWRRHPEPDLRSDEPDQLCLHFVQQRRADLFSCTIKVTDEDEANVRKFLADCAAKMRELWEPLLDQPA